MIRFRIVATAVALASVALAAPAVAAPRAAAKPPAPKVTTVTVSMTEYAFKLSKSVVPHGFVRFIVKNNGTIVHDFVVTGTKFKTPYLQPHKRYILRAVFSKPHTYQYLCSVGEHAFHGMQGSFRVVT